MADIDRYLQAILNAIYGEEVRGSIHDAIAAINTVADEAHTAAIDSRDSAQHSAAEAAIHEQTTLGYKNDAEQSASTAAASETAALASQNAAAISEANALVSQQVAEAAKQAAEASQQAAGQSEINAANSASKAATSEANAAESEEKAALSRTAADLSQQAAVESEANALASQQAAAESEANAAQSETNAADSEANALLYRNRAQEYAEHARQIAEVDFDWMEPATEESDGVGGLVPMPHAGEQDSVLCGDARYRTFTVSVINGSLTFGFS